MPYTHRSFVVAALLWMASALGTATPTASAAEPAAPAEAEGLQARPQVSLAGEWRLQWAAAAPVGATPAAAAAAPPPVDEAAWEAKPFTLPGKATLPAGKDGLWLARTLEIPADWQGDRVVVHLDHPMFAAEVYLNGQHLGSIADFGGEVDVSPAAKWGSPNELRLFFGRQGQGSVLDAWTAGVVATLTDYQKSQVGVLGNATGLYLERQPTTARVTDVWYRTWLRGYKRLEPQITVVAAAAVPGARVRVAVYEAAPGEGGAPVTAAPGSAPAAQLEFPLGDLPLGESVHRVQLPLGKLQLWGLRAPHLYVGQVTLLDATGAAIDRSTPTPFGIRDFWQQGNRTYLNGEAVNLTLDAYLIGGIAGLPELLAAGATLTYEKHAAPAAPLVHDGTDFATACDRLGMGHIGYGVSVGYDSPNLTDPAIMAAYRQWTAGYLKRHRNHPSILYWVLSTNSGGGDTHTPTVIGHSSKQRWNHVNAILSTTEHRAVDDSRPYIHHSAGGVGDLDSGNVYVNHTPVQEVVDWLSDAATKGDRPYMAIEFSGAPLAVDYLSSYSQNPLVSYAVEYAARLAGPAAYAAETPAYRAMATYRTPRQSSVWSYNATGVYPLLLDQQRAVHTTTYRAIRYWGVPADLWIFPPELKKYPSAEDPTYLAALALVQTAKDLLAPMQFWIGGPADDWTAPDHQYYAGEPIERSLVAVHDLSARRTVKVAWSAQWIEPEGTEPAAPIASESVDLELGPWSRSQLPIRFAAPAVDRVQGITITAIVSDGDGTVLATDRVDCSIWPTRATASGHATPTTINLPLHANAARAAAAAPWAIYDPEGETTALLRAAGASLTPYVAEGPRPAVLVLGRRALQQAAALPFSAADIQGGMRVVVFEQTGGDIERLGLRMEDHSARRLFPRSTEHPLLAGIDTAALANWRGSASLIGWGPARDTTRMAPSRRSHHWSNRGTVATNLIETPHAGAFQALIDGEFDLAYTPLLSWRHGRGELLLIQLDLTGRSVADPAADRIVDNLVGYLQAPLPGRPRDRTAMCRSAKTRDKILATGFKAELWDGVADLDPTQHVLVLGAGDAATIAPAETMSKIGFFYAAGGDAFVLEADKELVANLLFAGLKLQATRVDAALTVDEPAPKVGADLLVGIGPQHLHWREPLDLLLPVPGTSVGFQPLLGGLAGVVYRGPGRCVVLQIGPEALADYSAVTAGDEAMRKDKEKPLPQSWYAKNRARSTWQATRLRALMLGNLGVASSDELAATLFANRRKLPTFSVDKWLYLGPFQPAANPEDPLDFATAPYLAKRDLDASYTLPDGKSATWYEPSDFNNGLGMGGMMDLGKVYGVAERQGALALTYLWSSQERVATFQVGADWWMKFAVNGEEVFRTGTIKGASGRSNGTGFNFTVKVKLKKGWNELLVTVAAGSAGNAFWMQVSNPGDAIAKPAVAAPEESPWLFLRFAAGGPFRDLSSEELQAIEDAPAGFPLYAAPLTVTEDPYLFMRW